MKYEDCYFLIPARKGSKGFPLKNRRLFNRTAETIPKELSSRVYVSTDDEEIKQMAISNNFNVIDRPSGLACDKTSLKDVLEHFVEKQFIPSDSTIILLFLTYPQRTWHDIEQIYDYYKERSATSLICAEPVSEHPYLCFYNMEDDKAELVVKHDFYRRQDYPECFKHSMFFACYRPSVINKLHDLLFEKDTVFYKLNNKMIDVDYKEDYTKWEA